MAMMTFLLLLELPSELYLHVLIKLPLKYLMRLRCVSKFFLDLTNNPNFIASYCHLHSITNPDFNFMDTTTSLTSSLVLSSNQWQWQCQWRFHILFKGSNFIYSQKLDELIPFHPPSGMQLISSINGLVCFGRDYSLEIYNILAGTNYNLIPPIFTPTTPRYTPPTPIFVFGYDPMSNDYKILRIETRRHWTIYSFRTNSWKQMTNLYCNYGTIFYNSEEGRTVCINGVIYWPPGNRDYPHYNEIVLFDLHKEKFSEIQLPEEDLLLPTHYEHIQLLSFRGCLAFAFIKGTSTKTKTKLRKRKRAGGLLKKFVIEGEKTSSHYANICAELLKIYDRDMMIEILKDKIGRGEEEEEKEKANRHYADMMIDILKGSIGGGGEEEEKSSSHCGDIVVELCILKSNGGVDEAEDDDEADVKKYLWMRESFVVPIPPPPKEVEIVSCCDEIFLGWFESNQLRLYNLHTKCLFNLPLSPPTRYYPKVSFLEKKDPTYVDNLSFDHSLN